MKPHGLDLIMKEEILENGKVIHSSETLQNSFEGWIGIRNEKNKKYVELPMRSFVSTFISKLRYLLGGDAPTTAASESTKISTCSTASAAVHRAGLVLGTGTTPPSLSDTSIETVASSASLNYSVCTFQPPTSLATDPPSTDAQVRSVIQNNYSSAFYISEISLYGKKNASAAAGGAQMFSRDLIGTEELGGALTFEADSDIRFDFALRTTQSSTGGLVLNFSKLIYNLFFKGAPAPSGSKITSVTSTQPTYTYGNASMSTSKDFPYIKGTAAQIYWGIVIGDIETGGTDAIGIDDNTFDFMVDEFTCSANSISAVTSGSGQAYFTISRTFTNAATVSKFIDRVGILCKGQATAGGHDGTGASSGKVLHDDQFLIAVNTPTAGNISIQPSQTYRVTYTFKIQV